MKLLLLVKAVAPRFIFFPPPMKVIGATTSGSDVPIRYLILAFHIKPFKNYVYGYSVTAHVVSAKVKGAQGVWVAPTGEREISQAQDLMGLETGEETRETGQPRIYYRVTRAGYRAPKASSLTPSPSSTNTPGKYEALRLSA